jgi:acetyl esterase/lipase
MANRFACVLALGLVFGAVSAGRGDETKSPAKDGKSEVEVVRDLPYYEGSDADPVRHRLDVYVPRGQKDFPVLMFVHGGAWRSGVKDLYSPLGQLLGQHGIGAVIINYRLSPAVKHPAHIQDVARAFAWTYANIGKYGGRKDRLFISGHSAGAHLVALLATDPAYLKAEKRAVSDIRGVIALSGVYVITPSKTMETAFGKDLETCRQASPLTHVSGNHPPFLIVYADQDYPKIDAMSEAFCKRLQGCKCEAASLKIEDRTHITIIVRMAQATDPTTQALLTFITRHGKG